MGRIRNLYDLMDGEELGAGCGAVRCGRRVIGLGNDGCGMVWCGA